MARELQHMRPRLKAKLLSPGDRRTANEYLSRDSVRNLHLLELAASVGAPPKPGEVAPQVVGAWRGRELVGVASLRPGVTLDADMNEEVLDVLMPYLRAVRGGLIKSGREIATALWERLASRSCVAMVDRAEIACLVKPGDVVPVSLPPGAVLRKAVDSDLEALVTAARASLREEDRPDPCDGDPVGFRLWVRGRLHRARVVECDRQVIFVGYADVRRPEGWLVQGVYTWPYARRRGMAAAAMCGIACEAFEAGADHVQLAVIRGNTAAIGLYQKLGFSTFAELRTILFA